MKDNKLNLKLIKLLTKKHTISLDLTMLLQSFRFFYHVNGSYYSSFRKKHVFFTEISNFSKYLFSIVLVLVLFSCNESAETKKYRKLRDDVLAHYKDDTNPLKEKAAIFLLDNLKDRYFLEGSRYQAYKDSIQKYASESSEVMHNSLFSLRSKPLEQEGFLDVNELTPEYLINNIEQSFSAWEKAGWKDQVSFEHFCEYILPYRINNEPLEDWRNEIISDSLFASLSDTLSRVSEIRTACTLLALQQNEKAKKFAVKFGASAARIPDLQYSILKLLKAGTCDNLTHRSLFENRALAIPVANDFTPCWANSYSGHEWCSLITNSSSIPFLLPMWHDTLGDFKGDDNIPSKVYRHIYSTNKFSHASQRGYCNFLPGFLNNPRLLDVTDLYIPVKDIAIPINIQDPESEYVYLLSSSKDRWTPVGWGKNKKQVAYYSKVGYNTVYLPAFISKKGIKSFNAPFILSSDGNIHYLKPNLNDKRNIVVTRKHPLLPDIQESINDMIGGKFQVSNDKDFKQNITLYNINESPDVYYKDINVNLSNKFRYVRYLAPDSTRCQIAEIEFYGGKDNLPLIGEIIGIKWGWLPLSNAFDGNDLTYYTYSVPGNNLWLGMDLGKPCNLTKIRFAARNDRNHIIVGNTYELFYWDHEWKSLGQRIADDTRLVYDNVPSNCLFYLKNHTEGVEERIFTIKNSQQVWY